jgi:hypothetical protein
MNHIQIMIDGEVTQRCLFTQYKLILLYKNEHDVYSLNSERGKTA